MIIFIPTYPYLLSLPIPTVPTYPYFIVLPTRIFIYLLPIQVYLSPRVSLPIYYLHKYAITLQIYVIR